MTNLQENIFVVEVPEGATGFCWIGDVFACKMPDSKPGRYKWLVEADEAMSKIGGEWEVVCASKEVTSKEASTIVQNFNNGAYRDYGCASFYPCDELMDFFLDPKDSLLSLLASKGLTGKNYCILLKG